MELTKIKETNTTITLGWAPPTGVGGYAFYANGNVVSVATRNFKDGTPRNSVQFNKITPGPPFQVVAICKLGASFICDVGEYPTEVPSAERLAPRTYNKGTNDSDPRFCVHSPGVIRISADLYRDAGGYEYNSDGLNSGGKWRDRDRMVPGLKPANEMDNRGACDPYGPFPPWPPESYLH